MLFCNFAIKSNTYAANNAFLIDIDVQYVDISEDIFSLYSISFLLHWCRSLKTQSNSTQ